MRLYVFCLAAVLASLSFAETAKLSEPEEGRPKAKPKWADPDAWWEKLKTGLPEATVRNILGEPLYISKDSGGAKWYYQYRPKITDGMNGKFFSAPGRGYVYFENAVKVPQRKSHPAPIYVLAGWSHPDWIAVEAGAYDLPDPKKNLKPIRKLEPYEKQDAWNRLRFGINQQSVQRILGKPARTTRNIVCEEYYYDLPCGGATLRFESDALVSWGEPCWLAVELELYEEDQSRDRELKILDEKRIISIANKAFLSEGFSLQDFTVAYDDHNASWSASFQKLKERSPEFADRYEQLLRDKKYQAVEYVPDPNKVIAGTFYVFVDKENGNVIGSIGGV